MNNSGYIYKTTNMITGHIYIGKRIGKFNSSYWGSGIHLKRAIKKFGKYVFKTEVIVFADNKENLNTLEKYFIKKYREDLGRDELYNIANGGDGGNVWLNGSPSKEQRIKIGIASRNHKHTEETKLKLSLSRLKENNPMYGKHFKHTEETKEKIKKTKAEYPYRHSKERIEKIKKLLIGNHRAIGKRSKESCRNISIGTSKAMKEWWKRRKLCI